MGHEPVGLRAVHGFQRGFLLGQCRVKLVVAAALLFQALDQGTQPVGSLASSAVSSSPVRKGATSSASSSGSMAVMLATLSRSMAL